MTVTGGQTESERRERERNCVRFLRAKIDRVRQTYRIERCKMKTRGWSKLISKV